MFRYIFTIPSTHIAIDVSVKSISFAWSVTCNSVDTSFTITAPDAVYQVPADNNNDFPSGNAGDLVTYQTGSVAAPSLSVCAGQSMSIKKGVEFDALVYASSDPSSGVHVSRIKC